MRSASSQTASSASRRTGGCATTGVRHPASPYTRRQSGLSERQAFDKRIATIIDELAVDPALGAVSQRATPVGRQRQTGSRKTPPSAGQPDVVDLRRLVAEVLLLAVGWESRVPAVPPSPAGLEALEALKQAIDSWRHARAEEIETALIARLMAALPPILEELGRAWPDQGELSRLEGLTRQSVLSTSSQQKLLLLQRQKTKAIDAAMAAISAVLDANPCKANTRVAMRTALGAVLDPAVVGGLGGAVCAVARTIGPAFKLGLRSMMKYRSMSPREIAYVLSPAPFGSRAGAAEGVEYVRQRVFATTPRETVAFSPSVDATRAALAQKRAPKKAT